jgi:hypothetical protein
MKPLHKWIIDLKNKKNKKIELHVVLGDQIYVMF